MAIGVRENGCGCANVCRWVKLRDREIRSEKARMIQSLPVCNIISFVELVNMLALQTLR